MTRYPMIYTTQEVADLTNRSESAILKARQRLNLGMRKGRDWLFTAKDVEQIRAINPRGGRPRKGAEPVRPRPPVSVAQQKGPKPKEVIHEPAQATATADAPAA